MTMPQIAKFGEPMSVRHRSAIAAATVAAASLVTLLPLVATIPFLPPFGLLMLLAWRLRDPEILPAWAAVPLGLFDDLFSGQPLGCAMALWTLSLLAIEVIDTRLVWREFRHDWLVAGGAVSAFLIAARLAGTPVAAHVDTTMLVQIAVSVALYPLVAVTCARVDEAALRPR